MATRRKKPGPKPRAGKTADGRIELRVTPDERKAWERAAGDRPLSEWIRERCKTRLT